MSRHRTQWRRLIQSGYEAYGAGRSAQPWSSVNGDPPALLSNCAAVSSAPAGLSSCSSGLLWHQWHALHTRSFDTWHVKVQGQLETSPTPSSTGPAIRTSLHWPYSQAAAGIRALHQSRPVPGPLTPPPQPLRPPGSAADAESLTSLPNLISLGRAASGPFIAALILAEAWPAAIIATTVSGASDWADGALARRLGQSSVLGSYLDPLADKVLIGCVVGALASKGLVPAWLAVLVLGRDVGLVAGMALHRWRMLGWRVRGLSAAHFFTTLPAPQPTDQEDQVASSSARSNGGSRSHGSSSTTSSGQEAGLPPGSAGAGATTPQLPFMRPLLVSKLNTVLQLALVAGCMGGAAFGVPDPHALQALEVATASTTAASLLAYAWLYASGRMLPLPKA
ncbi:hypothetical protein V8C86DRAFT_736083 [Haematococcus lacustris]